MPTTTTTTMAPRGSQEALTAWRKQLKPWLKALGEAHLRLDSLELATVSDMERLWIHVLAPTNRRNNPAVWTLLIEAMELLELLARVDHKTAWRLLFEVAGEARTLELYEEQLIPSRCEHLLPRYVVKITSEELEAETEVTIQSCIRLIIVNEQTSSPKYALMKQAMLDQWKDQHNGHVFDRDTDGRVKISLNFCATMEFEDEGETGYVFTHVQNVAFAHYDLSLLERVDNRRPRDEGEDEGEDEAVEEEEDEDINGHEEEEEKRAEEQDEEQQQERREDDEMEVPAARVETADEVDEPEMPELVPAEDASDNGEEETYVVQRHNPNPPPRGPFEIESFRFDLLDNPVSNMVLYMINEAGKSGMCMSHIRISTVLHERLHHSVIGGFLLNQLVPWRGRRDSLGVQSLTIDLGAFDAAGVRAFCTAIAHSRSLREFQFRMDSFTEQTATQADGDVWWPWLAYALFSGDADHQIRDVWLNVETLEVGHVEMMRQVLNHTDPLAFLYQRVLSSSPDSSSSTTGPAVAASLNPSALLRLGHYATVAGGEDAPGVRVREPGVTYQVVRNRSEEAFIEILLPGTGVCWTERSELIELHPLKRREEHPIRELSLEGITDESAPALIALLPLIGEPIERLTLASIQLTASAAVFEAIQTSCLNLKRLRVYSANDHDWLYSPRIADWKLESLILQSVQVRDREIWTRFFDILSDSANALTQSLREFHFGISQMIFPVDSGVDYVLAKWEEMLAKNHRLTRCEVTGCGAEEFAKHKDRIMAHHNEPTCVQKTPLSREAKLAFLSAMTPVKPRQSDDEQRNEREQKRAKLSELDHLRTMLDSNALRTIMEMAAESERRVCGIAESSM